MAEGACAQSAGVLARAFRDNPGMVAVMSGDDAARACARAERDPPGLRLGCASPWKRRGREARRRARMRFAASALVWWMRRG
jgi:hypothetical protein